MPYLADVSWEEVQMGDEVTVWTGTGGSGQGGKVVRIWADQIVVRNNPGDLFTFLKEEVHHITQDQFLEPEECLEYHSGNCQGVVDYCPAPPWGEKSFPRCEKHNRERWDRYDNSDTEKFAASSRGVIPDWYDPESGERLEDDY